MTEKLIKNQKGFTILELVIVLVIIGILGAFLYPQFSGKENSSKITSVETETLRWYEAGKSYVSNHGQTDYTNATKANIVSDNLKADNNNAFGKTWTVAAKTGDATKLEVVTNADTAASATAVADKLTAKGYTSTASGTQVTTLF